MGHGDSCVTEKKQKQEQLQVLLLRCALIRITDFGEGGFVVSQVSESRPFGFAQGRLWGTHWSCLGRILKSWEPDRAPRSDSARPALLEPRGEVRSDLRIIVGRGFIGCLRMSIVARVAESTSREGRRCRIRRLSLARIAVAA